MRTIDAEAAHVLLANLGFLLVPGPPLDHGAAYLLIAMRPQPTRAHFDPERIDYWHVVNGHSEGAQLAWPLQRTHERFAWGTIAIADRLAVVNRFVAFGGELAVSRDNEVHAALFRSPAPILSVGGHSEPADPLAAQIAGFFATLRGAAGYDSPVKDLAERLDPVALYSAFVVRAIDRYRQPDAVASVSPHLVSLLRSEIHRLESSDAAPLRAGRELAALIETAPEIVPANREGA